MAHIRQTLFFSSGAMVEDRKTSRVWRRRGHLTSITDKIGSVGSQFKSQSGGCPGRQVLQLPIVTILNSAYVVNTGRTKKSLGHLHKICFMSAKSRASSLMAK